jgi:5S rRNA maturation endonuclease (ribonuclease M5)
MAHAKAVSGACCRVSTNKRKGLRSKKINWKHFYELEARLKKIIDDVNYSVSAVIVEGKRDEEALRSAGLRSTVVQFSSSGLPAFAFIEEIVAGYRGSTVLVLLDFDREGDELAERLSQELEEGGVLVQRMIRREIAKVLIREGILRIEEISMLRKKASV